MTINLSPEVLVRKYIKSATNGKVIPVRIGRLLTLILIPLWIGGVIWSGIMSLEGIKAINKTKRLEEAIRFERKNSKPYYPNGGTMLYESPYLQDLQQKLTVQQDKRDFVFYFPAYIIIAFILPWIIVKLIFWVIDAKEVVQISKTK